MDEITIENIRTAQSQEYLAVACNQTYSYASNTLFFACVNPTYFDYYNRVLRINLEWYDGYVAGFHNQQNGIFSTRIGSAIVDGTAQQIVGKGIQFKNADKNNEDNHALSCISKWAKSIDFSSVLEVATKYMLAGGTCCLKLNQSWSDLWIEAVRGDNFYFETNFKGELKDIVFFIKNYTNTISKGNKDNYFLVEHRYFKKMPVDRMIESIDPNDGVSKKFKTRIMKLMPVVSYQVFRYSGQIMQNVNSASLSNGAKGLGWNDIPLNIRHAIKEDFTAIRVNEDLILPFANNLGCELLRNGRDGNVPLAIFGESLLTKIRAYLEEYECAFAYEFRDLRQGQGQIGFPKALSINDMNNKSFSTAFSDTNSNYQLYPGNPDTQKPIITQFNLRADEWAHVKDNILKKIATTIGMSPKIIASYLADISVQKTATETNSDDVSVIAFIENKRAMISRCVNKIIDLVSVFYGFVDNVGIRFISQSSSNEEKLLANVDFKYKNGYISLKEAIRQINPTADELELKDLFEQAEKRQLELNNSKIGEINGLGEFDE